MVPFSIANTNSNTTAMRFVGPFELVGDSVARVNVDGGYWEGGRLHGYVTDRLGNVRGVRSFSGGTEQVTEYYPYGTPSYSVNPTLNPYKYGGKRFDTRNGMDMAHHGARMLLNDLGRFASPDPLAELTPGISPYLYCGADPINRTDPTGLLTMSKEMQVKYPELAIYLRSGIQGILEVPVIMNALMTYSQRSLEQIKQDLTFGNGPTIQELDKAKSSGYGLYTTDPINISNIISISPILMARLQELAETEGAISLNYKALLFFLGVTILHEYCHWGDMQDKIDSKDIEDGNLFEEGAYGCVIDSYEKALEMVRAYCQRNNIDYYEHIIE